MRIVFRADASILIGTGHVMRCLTLADALREHGASCAFVCRQHPGNLLDLIRQRGYETMSLPNQDNYHPISEAPAHAKWLGTDWVTDAHQTCEALAKKRVDWLVVDHYALDRNWEKVLHPYCRNLMAIDDLADRAHDCDLLLDQNLGRIEQDYRDLLPLKTCRLIGPQFALLRPDFARWRNYSITRRATQKPASLLIAMGGVDQNNVTGQVLVQLSDCILPSALSITVVMGPHAPSLSQVQMLATEMAWPTRVLTNISDMAQLMAESDFAIGAAGGTAWERCAVGLPTILLLLAENQRKGAEALHQAGAAVMVQEVSQIPEVLASFIGDPSKLGTLHGLSRAAADLVDGNGTTRVLQKMICNHV